ncbi:hypothetical protein ANN_14575 [Periplaneta americana]|uniref:Aminopeptidase N-like N-terminal domain-containing protein n=1 Tax=Periplaneta americana TaxID=6978 RepID=A0ABQ8SWN2_PERAM|nr:hypothetical protein ANN_14575 [Periplaneta americana]
MLTVLQEEQALPRTVKPYLYLLDLHPRISEGYFNGSVDIHIQCLEPTRVIVLHASYELQLENVNLTAISTDYDYDVPTITEVARNGSTDTLNITLEEELTEGRVYRLHLEFHGLLKNNDYMYTSPSARGFFRDMYTDRETRETRWFAWTSTFPGFARHLFPCFDEPSFRAEFTVGVSHLTNMTVLTGWPSLLNKSVSDMERRGHPKSATNEKHSTNVMAKMPASSTSLVRYVARESNRPISRESVRRILNSNYGEEIRFTKSERDSDKLIYLGYMYTRLRENKNGVVWRCDMRGGCMQQSRYQKMEAVPSKNCLNTIILQTGEGLRQRNVENMEARAGTSREPTSVIIQNELQRIASEANVNLPKKPSIKKTVRRARKLHLPPEPRNIGELNVTADRYTKTIQGERWLLYFEPEDNVNVIIFATNSHLNKLLRSHFWIMDGVANCLLVANCLSLAN